MSEWKLKTIMKFITGAKIILVVLKIKVYLFMNILLNFIKYILIEHFLIRFHGLNLSQMKPQ